MWLLEMIYSCNLHSLHTEPKLTWSSIKRLSGYSSKLHKKIYNIGPKCHCYRYFTIITNRACTLNQSLHAVILKAVNYTRIFYNIGPKCHCWRYFATIISIASSTLNKTLHAVVLRVCDATAVNYSCKMLTVRALGRLGLLH